MDEEDFRLWICYYQKVPRKVIISSDSSTLEDLTKGINQLYVLFQPKKEDDMFDFKKQCMIYINFFFSGNLLKRQAIDDDNLLKKQLAAPLQYLTSLSVLQNAAISSIIPLVNKNLGFNESAKLDCYQVPLNNNLQKLSDDSNLKEYGIGNGSILIFQMKQESINQIKQGSLKIDFDFQSPTENSIENNLTSSLNCFSEIDFNDDIIPSKSIENYFVKYFVVEVYNYKELTVPLFNIQLSYSISGSNAKKYIFEAALKNKNIDENVDEKTVTFFHLIANKFYEINDSDRMYEKQYKIYFSIPSFDTKQAEIKVQFSPDSKTVIFEKTISLKDCKSYDDVFNAFKSSCSKEEEGQLKELFNENNSFRFLIIKNERIEKVLSDYDYLGDLRPDEKMRIEVVPKNQLNTEMYSLLKTFYSNAELSKSMSFLFDIKMDEKFSETKKRLTDYLNIQEGETLDILNFYLKIADKSFLSLIIEDENTVKDRNGSNSKISDVHDYSILSLNDAEIVQLDDSSVLSVFSRHGSFMLQLEIVSNKYDETKMKKIPLSSLKTNLSTRNHTDLRIYN
ncbi:hypothetical protein M9Y10_042638 [Tritrichomonas musculus]|uniref:ubiquitinyl hydrolase 1 n=1 Tax=Tritrichomonas musculus TaxID=1915356 RepID=A0ABR2JXE2_9EUKA